MNTFNKRMMYSIELFAIILACLVFATYYNIKRADSREFWVKHSNEVLINIGRVQLLASESEINARNYVMSGNPAYVKQFTAANITTLKLIQNVSRLTTDNNSIVPDLDSLKRYLIKRIDFHHHFIITYKQLGWQKAITLIQTGEGQIYASKTSYFINRLEQNENRLLNMREAETKRALIIMNVSLIVTVAFITIMIIMLLRKGHKENVARNNMVTELTRRNRTLEEFTYIVSHNLRVPVANIIGLSQLLEIDCVDDPHSHQKVVEKMLSSVSRLDNIVCNLNMVLQVHEQLNNKKEHINLSALVKKVELSLKPLIDFKKTKIICHFEKTHELYSIRTYMQSIFYNIIQNSVKYSYADVPSIIHLRAAVNHDTLEITFTDNGKGIDLEKNGDLLFGLYRHFGSTGGEAESKGMGLFIVKTQIEALGGSIHVKSQLNKGTEFSVMLPLLQNRLGLAG